MSSKSPRLTAKEIIRQLQDNGFVEISQNGSHKKFFNPGTRRTAIVPVHKGQVIAIGTIKSIEKQSGIIFS